MDLQLAFVILISLLTGSAVVVSVYVIFVLKDVRGTLKKANGVLDNAGDISEAVKHPLVGIMSIADGVVNGIRAARGISSIVGIWDKKEGKSKEDR